MAPRFISILLCSFIFGVILGSLYIFPQGVLWFTFLVGAGLSVVLLFYLRAWGLCLIFFFTGVLFGIWYVQKSFVPNEYESFVGQTIDLEGVIATDPVTSNKSQVVNLKPDGFTQLIRASLYNSIPGAQQGDYVWIRGQVQYPENFDEFDYIGYLQRWQVYATLKKPKVIVLHRAPFSWRTPFRQLHNYVVKKMQVYSAEEGSLVLGILIGERTTIPDEVVQAFKTTGLTHIVAVSGFNMTIIATACGSLVWLMGRRATNLVTLFVVFAFVVVTGASASVVRAAIMAVLMVVAQLIGRQYTSMHALLIVCVVMILQNPRIVVWDIGFQLSVAATVGVLVAFQIKKPGTKETFLSENLRPTLGAIAITAPIIAYHFQTFSLIAPIANLIVLPSVTWIMLIGALSLLPYIGGAFVYPAQELTSLALFATKKLALVPYASINLNFPIWIYGLYYVAVVIYIYKRTLQNHKKYDKV